MRVQSRVEEYRHTGGPVKWWTDTSGRRHRGLPPAGFYMVIKGRGEPEALGFVAAYLWLYMHQVSHDRATMRMRSFELVATLKELAAASGFGRPMLSRALRAGAKAKLWGYASSRKGIVVSFDWGGLHRRYQACMKEGREGVLVPAARVTRFLLHHRIDHLPAGWLRQPVARVAHWLRTTRPTLRRRVNTSGRIFTRRVAKSTTADTPSTDGRPYTSYPGQWNGGRRRSRGLERRRGRAPPGARTRHDRPWTGTDPETGEPFEAPAPRRHVDAEEARDDRPRQPSAETPLELPVDRGPAVGSIPTPFAPNPRDGLDRPAASDEGPAVIPVARLFRGHGRGLQGIDDILRTPRHVLDAQRAPMRRAVQLAASPTLALDAIDWMTKARPTRTRLLRQLARELGGASALSNWIRRNLDAALDDLNRPAAASFHFRVIERLRGGVSSPVFAGGEEGAPTTAPHARRPGPPPATPGLEVPPAPVDGWGRPSAWAARRARIAGS